MGDIMRQVPKYSPLMRAWDIWKKTDAAQNARKWAASPHHVYGSLWAAFMAGFNANAAPADLVEALEAFLRAPSIGSNGPGSITIEVQKFNIDAARTALAKCQENSDAE